MPFKIFQVILILSSISVFRIKGQETIYSILENEKVSEINGTLVDGSGMENYRPGTDASIEFDIPGAEYIFFYFEELDLRINDIVSFETNGISVADFSGNNLSSPRCVKMDNSRVTVNFRSDENDEGQGFKLAWQAFFPTSAGPFRFKHHLIEQFSGVENGRFGPLLLADLDGTKDRNGNMDIILGISNTTGQNGLYLYENTGGMSWKPKRNIDTLFWGQHTSGEIYNLDNDPEGLPDIIIAGKWYENRGNLHFIKHVYDPQSLSLYHDVRISDIFENGKDQPEIITMYNTGNAAYPNHFNWYRSDEIRNSWVRTDFNMMDYAVHSSLGPNGIGDLNNDGNPDLVLRDHILLLKDKNKLTDTSASERRNAWQTVNISENFGKNNHHTYGNWGRSACAYISDMNDDGYPDIVISDCDMLYSQLAILYNDGSGTNWTTKYLLRTSNYGSLHTLQVADFDGDGDKDILTIDQEDVRAASKCSNLEKAAFYIWENQNGNFIERTIWDENFGGHQAIIGDIDSDGDIDFVSKVWVGKTGFYNGLYNGEGHLDVFENVSNENLRTGNK